MEANAEQRTLIETSVRLMTDQMPMTVVRTRMDAGGHTLSEGYLGTAAGLGWFAMLVPEEAGGGSYSGNALEDLSLVAIERGAHLQPGPFAETAVVAMALARVERSELADKVVPRLVSGEVRGAWVPPTREGDRVLGHIAVVAGDDGSCVLNGVAKHVLGGVGTDYLLVASTCLGEDLLILVPRGHPGVGIAPVRSLDLTNDYCEISFAGASVPSEFVVARGSAAGSLIQEMFDHSLVLQCADTVGAAAKLFELTCEYALERRAFGRRIGSFQAIKHQLADLSVKVESARSVLDSAIRSVAEGADDSTICVAMAKAWTSEIAPGIAQGCFQIFGGIGFAWEHDCHLFMRRIQASSQLLGSPEAHYARVFALYEENGRMVS